MAEQPLKPPLQKPPGYRDPGAPPLKPGPVPHRRPSVPPSFQNHRNNKKTRRRQRRSVCRICCCFLFVFTLLLTLAGAAAAGLFYLWFDPKLPSFHLQSLKFSAFNVTSRPDDGMTFLSSAAVARVEAKNPNAKLELYYGAGRVEVAAGAGDAATGLGGDDVAGFFQERGNVTSLRGDVAAKGVAVEEGVGRRLRNGFKSKGLVVGVILKVRIGYVVQGIRVWSVRVRVVCGGVSLKRLHHGDAPKCAIEVLKWIKIR